MVTLEGMEPLLRVITLGLSGAIELVAALTIAFGAFQALWLTVKGAATHGGSFEPHVRLQLGRWLVLSLEFLVAADILRTAVAPSWNDIGMLAAVIAVRTLLSFTLEREMKDVEAAHERAQQLNDRRQASES